MKKSRVLIFRRFNSAVRRIVALKLQSNPLELSGNVQNILSPIVQLTILVKDLTKLKSDGQVSVNKAKSISIIPLVKHLKILKRSVFIGRKNRVFKDIAANKSFLQLSTFELMEYDFHENTHSNVLEYLFNYKINGSIGSKVLQGVVEQLNNEEAQLFKKYVKKCNYVIEREKSTGTGRMDLFISDTTNKFVIVIENKIFAKVSERESIDTDTEPITQLTIYRDYVAKRFKGYKTLYILLSHTDVEQDHYPFIYVSYKDLYNVCYAIKSEDDVFHQYKLLLHSLAHNILNKRELNDQIAVIQTNKSMDLNNLQIISGALHGRY